MSDREQRWREGRTRFVCPPIVFDPSIHHVEPLCEATAKAFVECHHYSESYPAARVALGLFRRGELVGVAVFSTPSRKEVITNPFPGVRHWLEGVDLGRFVLLDEEEFNAETWFLGRCRRLLGSWPDPPGKRSTWPRHLAWSGFRAMVAFADPHKRYTVGGQMVLPGHVGGIYRSDNARLVGRSRPSTLRLLPDAHVLHNEKASKIRLRKTGWRAAVEDLLAYGVPEPKGDLALWLEREVLSKIVRRMAHGGNWKWAWSLPARGRVAKRYAERVAESMAPAIAGARSVA